MARGGFRRKIHRAGLGVAAAAVVTTMGGHAGALPIKLADGWEVNWDTTLSIGSSWRAQQPDSKLYMQADGAQVGLSGGTAGSHSDANTLNYKKGDRFSTLIKVLSDLSIKRGDFGALMRVKAWKDQALTNRDARYGNQANGYAKDAPLSDSGFSNMQRFENVALMDAYVYNTFNIADKPLQVRLGRQVINWGESLFFQGMNQINPLDISALRKPGTQIKEAFLPVWAAYGNLGLGDGVSLEAFYQFAWERSNLDACGTYWSTVDTSIGANPGRCDKILIGPSASSVGAAAGSWAPLVKGREPRDSGQFGAALRIPVDALDTEFGVYAMNIHSRTPIISTRSGSWGLVGPLGLLNPLMAHQIALSQAGVRAASAYWEYPDDVQYYGVSATTNIAGWSLSAEASYTPNLPVQRNGNDLLNGLLTGGGPMGGVYGTTASLTDVRGYDRLKKAQLQINGIKTFGGVLGASKSTFMGEAAFQFNDVPNYRNGTSIRYGRSFIFGTASSAGVDTCAAGALNNPQSDGCKNDGFVTKFSWGYRLRGELEYPQFMGTPLTFSPSLSIAHDVSGVSADNQLNEGRFQTGVNMRFTYNQSYNLDLGYVHFADWAKYDPLRDHDFYSLSFSATF